MEGGFICCNNAQREVLPNERERLYRDGQRSDRAGDAGEAVHACDGVAEDEFDREAVEHEETLNALRRHLSAVAIGPTMH